MKGATRESNHRGVARVAHVLSMFDGLDDQISLTDAVARLDLHKSTAYRYLVSLEQEGILQRCRAGGFQPGPLLRRLTARLPHTAPDAEDDTGVNGRVLRDLAQAVGETVVLCHWDGDAPLVVRCFEAEGRSVRLSAQLGEHLPLDSGPGRIFLTHLPIEPYGSPPPANDEIAHVRRVGIAFGRPLPDGVTILASPVMGSNGIIRAALGLVVVTGRVAPHHLAPQARHLRRAAAIASTTPPTPGGCHA
jgi:DNA-binding IclR family transcriptional regulator